MSPEKSIESVRAFEQKALEIVAARTLSATVFIAPEPVSQVAAIAQWFVKAVPAPTDKNRAVQFGCHIEEVSEMFEAMGHATMALQLHEVGNFYKKAATNLTVVDRDALLDSLCDQVVTAVGVAHMLGLDIQGALTEVNRSNWSKFVDGKPVFDENGKIAKNMATYSKPDLSPFVGAWAQSSVRAGPTAGAWTAKSRGQGWSTHTSG